jgi:thioredoxin 1
MIEITQLDFEKEVLECESPVFVCFTTGWCHSCYPTCLLADQLDTAYDNRVKFVKLDKEKSPEIAKRYNIIAVPTMLIFQDAQPVERLLGFQDRDYLREILDNRLAKVETIS